VINTYETDPASYAFDRVIQQEINSAGSGCCGFSSVGTVTLSYELLDPDAGVGDMNTARTRTVVTDSLGSVTEYYHNAVGGLLRTTERSQTRLASSPTALVTEYTYNYNVEQVAVTYPKGNRLEYTYDEVVPDRLQQANLLREEDIPDPKVGGDPLVTTYAYEPAFNQVISEINPAGDTTAYAYDDSGNRTTITDTLGYTTIFTYDERGTQTGETDANGNETIIDDYYLAPPYASFIVTPTWGPAHTIFLFDASPSWDVEDASADLQVRWDWEDDGQYDTPYTTVKTATHQYLTYGPRVVRLEVLDSDHLTA
jgi:YD repeat-containing protein